MQAWQRRLIAACLALCLGFFAGPVLAGGLVIAPDPPSATIVAGDETAIGFTVTYHGREPALGLRPDVSAIHESGERVLTQAAADGAPGHYVGRLRFPQVGVWSLAVTDNDMAQLHLLPPIVVRTEASVPANSVAVTDAAEPFLGLSLPAWATVAAMAAAVTCLVAGLVGWRGTRDRADRPATVHSD
ncbi:MAG TPA: hypothetical protein VHL09_04550 [Dehalococcoidia bacterium]|nr:hypothetical protein [Dehalococcoidia bacterium]